MFVLTVCFEGPTEFDLWFTEENFSSYSAATLRVQELRRFSNVIAVSKIVLKK